MNAIAMERGRGVRGVLSRLHVRALGWLAAGGALRRMSGAWLVPALCLTLASMGAAQQSQVRARAVLSSGLVKLGGQVELRVEVENAESCRILSVPEVENMEILGPSQPETSSYAHRMNGRLYSRTTVAWTLILRPLEAGDFEIPPLRVEVDGEVRNVPDEPIELKVKKDIAGAELGFLEIENAPTRVYEGQPFTLDLRFGWADVLTLTGAALYLPWWSELPGTLDVAKPPRSLSKAPMEIVVNRRLKVLIDQLAGEQRGEHEFEVYSLTRRLIASRPGELRFPQSTFEFSELVTRGRGFEPDRRREFYANLEGFAIEVLPIPEKDRPLEWTGAVGMLKADRRVDVRDVDAGGSLELELAWTGEANVEFFELPDLERLDAFEGFQVLGVKSEHDALTRRATYDLVPLTHELTEIPSVPLWTFDPETERFTRIETEPVPIRVRPVEGIELPTGPDEEVFDIRDVKSRALAGGAVPAPASKTVWWTLLGVVVGWFLLRKAVRRAGDPAAPAIRRRRTARSRLGRNLRKARTAEEQSAALATFLGAVTGETDLAWLGRDPETWAAEREVALHPDLVAELRELQSELDVRAWGAGNEPLETRRIEKVATKVVSSDLLAGSLALSKLGGSL